MRIQNKNNAREMLQPPQNFVEIYVIYSKEIKFSLQAFLGNLVPET
jgi:hypothetical protein